MQNLKRIKFEPAKQFQKPQTQKPMINTKARSITLKLRASSPDYLAHYKGPLPNTFDFPLYTDPVVADVPEYADLPPVE